MRPERHIQVDQPRPAILARQRSGVRQGIVRGVDAALLGRLAPLRVGLDLDRLARAVVAEYGHVADAQAVRHVVQDRELVILPVGQLDGVKLGGYPCLAGPDPGRSVLAQGDDGAALEAEDPPGQRIADAPVLPGQALAHAALELPGLQKRGIPAGLRLRRARLRRLTVLYPLDRHAERVMRLLGLADVANQLLLELVAVLHIRSGAQLQDKVRQRLLRSLAPRMSEHVIRQEPRAEQPHAASVAPGTPGSECIAPSVMTKGYGGGMADQEDRTPGDVASMVANPFYAINIDEGLALPHEPLISEDDWVRANVGLIEELGPEAYLRNLLSILKGNYPRG